MHIYRTDDKGHSLNIALSVSLTLTASSVCQCAVCQLPRPGNDGRPAEYTVSQTQFAGEGDTKQEVKLGDQLRPQGKSGRFSD